MNHNQIVIAYSDLQKVTATISRNRHIYKNSGMSGHELSCQVTAHLKRDDYPVKGGWNDCEEEKIAIQYNFTKIDELFDYVTHGDNYVDALVDNGKLTELGVYLIGYLDNSHRAFGEEIRRSKEKDSVITLVYFQDNWHVFPVGLTELTGIFSRELLLAATSVSTLENVKDNLSRATCLKVHSRLHSPSSLSLGAEMHCDVDAVLKAIDDKNDFEFEQCRRTMAVYGASFLDLRSEEDRELDSVIDVQVFKNIIIIK